VQGGGDGKFKVTLERTDTFTKQAEMMVEARSEEEARQIILTVLEIDSGSYDDDLEPVSEGTGDMKVTSYDPTQCPWPVASRA
jgi:hypothetical protein